MSASGNMLWRPLESLMIGLTGLVGRMPRSAAMAVGGGLGRIAGRLPSRKRRRVAANALRCGASDPRKLFRSSTREAGRTVFELLWMMGRARDDVLAGVEVEGIETLDQAHREGRGVMLVSGHCATWDLVALAAAAPGRPVAGTARHWRFGRLERKLVDIRRRGGVETFFRDEQGTGIAAYRWLARGGVYCCMMDRISSGRRRGVPFFDCGLMLPVGPAEMACRTGAAVVTGYASRDAGGRSRVRFRRIPDSDFHDPDSLLDRIGEAVEEQVRSHPDQWFWIFRRPGQATRACATTETGTGPVSHRP